MNRKLVKNAPSWILQNPIAYIWICNKYQYLPSVLFGRWFEVGNVVNTVRISCNSQIWSLKQELWRFALRIIYPTTKQPFSFPESVLNSFPHCFDTDNIWYISDFKKPPRLFEKKQQQHWEVDMNDEKLCRP